MTIIAVSTAQELMEALESANGGDRIELAAGDYGDLKLKNVVFDAKVTIASADPDAQATFNTVDLYGVENLSFDDVFFDFHPTADTQNYHSALRVNHSSHISVSNSKFEGDVAVEGYPVDTDPAIVGSSGIEGYPVGRAAIVNWSEDITFSGNEMSMFRAGITVAYVEGLTIENTELHDLRTTAINGGDVSDVVLIGNHVYDMQPWAPLLENGVVNSQADHGDFVHFWTIDGQDGPSKNFYIADNFFELGTDGTQNASVLGIYIDDRNQGIGFENILIENNVLHNDALQGVALENTQGVVIRDNTFLQSGGPEGQAPGVVLRDGSRDVIIENNILTEIDGVSVHIGTNETLAGLNVSVSNNLQVQRFNPEADNYVNNFFVNALTPNGDLEDFKVIPGSAADGVGAKLLHVDGNSSLAAITAKAQGGLETLNLSVSVTDLLGKLSDEALGTKSVVWDFGDGTTAIGHDVVHAYAKTGSYNITGTLTTAEGEELSLSKVVEVKTPNGIDVRFDTGILDLSDTQNSVTVTGDAQLVNTAAGKALHLKNSDARVKFDINEELSNNPNFTFSFDFKYDDDSQSGHAIYFPGTTIIELDNGELKFVGKTSLNENIIIKTDNLKLDDSNWHRVSYVLSQATGTASLYIDGSLAGNIFGLEGIQPPSQSHGLTIGSPFGKSFTGQIDNVSFLRAALTKDDIDLLHGGTVVSLSELEGVSAPEEAEQQEVVQQEVEQQEVVQQEAEQQEVAQLLVVEVANTQQHIVNSIVDNAQPEQIVAAFVADPETSTQSGSQAHVQTVEPGASQAVQPTVTIQPTNQDIDPATFADLNAKIDGATLQDVLWQLFKFSTDDEDHDSGGWLEWGDAEASDSLIASNPFAAVGNFLLNETGELQGDQPVDGAAESTFFDEFVNPQDTFEFG